jgi:hypothetical protein
MSDVTEIIPIIAFRPRNFAVSGKVLIVLLAGPQYYANEMIKSKENIKCINHLIVFSLNND